MRRFQFILIIIIAFFLSNCKKKDKEIEDEPIEIEQFDPNEGQTNWTKIPYDTIHWEWPTIYYGDAINSIHFVNENIGYIAGFTFWHEPLGVTYKTIDGGLSWNRINEFHYGAGTYAKTVLFFNEQHGFVSDLCNTSIHIKETIDGGSTWSNLSINIGDHGNNAKVFIDNNKGIIGNVKTIDGGNNWSSMNLPTGYSNYIRSYSFLNDTFGLYTTSVGNIAKTYDFGENWNTIAIDTLNDLQCIHILDTNTYIIGGSKILKSTDNGQSWYTTYEGELVKDIKFIDNQIGFAVTATDTHSNNIYKRSGKILKTIDGGETWTTNYSSEFMSFYAIEIINNQTIVVVGGNGNNVLDLDFCYILKTTTQGN